MKVTTKNYEKKFGKAITSAPITEHKDLLIQDKKNNLKKIHPLDVSFEGTSFKMTRQLYKDIKNKFDAHKKATGHSISALISLLKEKGYNTPNIDLDALIGDISRLVIIEPSKQYDILHNNADGYVVGSSVLISDDIVIEVGDKPDDFANGYWKYIDGQWILDKDKYNEIWGNV